MKKLSIKFNLLVLILLVPCVSFAARIGEDRRVSHNYISDETGQPEPDDNRNGTPNEAGDEMPLFYFDETTQECVDTTGTDTDSDGVFDGCDNCLYVANPDQEYDEDLGTGGVACNGDINFQPAPADEPPPAAADETTEPEGDTSTTRGAFLADDGGSCTLTPSSKMPSAHPIFWIVGMTVAVLAFRRKTANSKFQYPNSK